MDEDSIESSEPIYELASECEKLFSEHVSKLKNGADLNGSRVVGEYQQRFSAWAAFLGVFAVPEMCLDRRLQRHVDIQDLVLRLLDIMKRNLTYLFDTENVSVGENIGVAGLDGDSSPQLQLHISIESLRGIEGAIERLHHLGGTIQLSSEASQATKLGKFAARLDSTSFEGVAQLAISSFYPDASPSLIELLAHAMTDMYQKFQYRRSRQIRLKPRPQLHLDAINEESTSQNEAVNWKIDQSPVPPPIKDIHKRLVRPIVMSHLGARSHQSKDSKPTSLDSKEFKKLFPQRKDGSVKSKTKSIAASMVAYPRPSDKSLKHLNEDFKPFFYLSKKCSDPLRRFATSRAWFTHMLETHGQNWHREVHLPAWWICPLCNSQETTYSKSQDLSEHVSSLHGDVFTEQQIQVIVNQSRLRAPRPHDVCPLCCLSMKDEQDSDEGDQAIKKAFSKLSVQGEQITEIHKRIKTEAGSVQLGQHNDVKDDAIDQATSNSKTAALQSRELLNVEKIARHVAAHLQGIMLFSLRMMVIDTVPDKSTDDKTLSGDTDDDLSRFGSNQQRSLQESQEIDDTNDTLVQDESMDIDDPLLLEDTIPDCEDDMNWQEIIPNSEPLPEADSFLQQVIDSGAFQTQDTSSAHEAELKIEIRPRTPPATIIVFPFHHNPDFIGHAAILHDLVSKSSLPPARLALVGIGGIGKTQLTIELACQLVKLAKMSVFWINAESRSSIDQGFKNIALSIAPLRKPSTIEASLRIASDWLSKERNGRWILILDGANDHSIFHDEFYLPKSHKGTIILTTRRRDVAYRLTENQQDVVHVGSMSVIEAVTLLERKLGRIAQNRFPKNDAASDLVKALGLVPLAICRAATYMVEQHVTTRPPIKDKENPDKRIENSKNSNYSKEASDELEEAAKYPSADDDSFPEPHQSKHAITPRMPFAKLPPEDSPRDESPSLIADSGEQNIHSNIYDEIDEDDDMSLYGDAYGADDIDDYDDIYYEDLPESSRKEDNTESKTEEKAEEKEEEKTALLNIEEQMIQLTDSEEEKIKLLDFEVYNPDQSGQFLKSLYRTWTSSFDAIRIQKPSAHSLLSLMSYFDRRGIPKWLLRPSRRHDSAKRATASHLEGDANDEQDIAFNEDIEILMNHGLVTSNGNRQIFQMLGLIQLAAKKNIIGPIRTSFEQQFINRLARAFPKSQYSNWEICEELFAHVQVAASHRPSNHSVGQWVNLLHEGARFARLQGRYEIAMQMADQALAELETLGRDRMKTLTLIALIYMDRGLYDEAEDFFTLALDAAQQLDSQVSDDRTGTSMNNLASVYKVKGQWEKAEDIQIEVQSTRESNLGPNHPKTLASKASLASTYRAQGRYLRAEGLQKEAVEGYRNRLGPDHPLTLTSMSNLGSIYRLQGKLLEAQSIQVQAMESLKIKLGADHPDTLATMNCLASTYRARGLLDEAAALQIQTLELREMKLGPDHPGTLASMNNLALIYSAQGNYREAARLQHEVVEICKKKLGPEHPHTLTGMNNLALIWKGQGRDMQGKRKMDECVETRSRILGQFHPYTLSSKAAARKWWASS
ncbi:hypothetical protein V8C35DRAFT_333533 [Trichoderma chlorosporum]